MNGIFLFIYLCKSSLNQLFEHASSVLTTLVQLRQRGPLLRCRLSEESYSKKRKCFYDIAEKNSFAQIVCESPTGLSRRGRFRAAGMKTYRIQFGVRTPCRLAGASPRSLVFLSNARSADRRMDVSGLDNAGRPSLPSTIMGRKSAPSWRRNKRWRPVSTGRPGRSRLGQS